MKKIAFGCLGIFGIFLLCTILFVVFGAIETTANNDTSETSTSLGIVFVLGCILTFFLFRKLLKKEDKIEDFVETNNSVEEASVYAKEFGKAEFLEMKSTKFPSKYLKPIKDLPDNGSFFYGKKVVITGGLESFPFREALAKKLWELGADIDSSIGKYTEVAIVGSYNVGPKKMEKILSQNIRIIREAELIDLLSNEKNN